jgi:hypothetical protein
MREQHRELHGELGTNLIRDAHTRTTSYGTGSNTLMICKPLAAEPGTARKYGNRSNRHRSNRHRAGPRRNRNDCLWPIHFELRIRRLHQMGTVWPRARPSQFPSHSPSFRRVHHQKASRCSLAHERRRTPLHTAHRPTNTLGKRAHQSRRPLIARCQQIRMQT